MRTPATKHTALVLPLLVMPIGCDRVSEWQNPETAACKQFILGGLRSPSTYEQTSVSRMQQQTIENRTFQTVTIEYDASNAFGTPVRGTQNCEFEIVTATGKFLTDPKLAATLASADRALGREGGNSCCVPPIDVKPGDPLANVTMDDLALTNDVVEK